MCIIGQYSLNQTNNIDYDKLINLITAPCIIYTMIHPAYCPGILYIKFIGFIFLYVNVQFIYLEETIYKKNQSSYAIFDQQSSISRLVPLYIRIDQCCVKPTRM